MKRFSTSILMLAMLAAPAFMACGDDEITEPGPGVDTVFPDTTPNDVGPETTQPDIQNPQVIRGFDFEQAFGDDQRPCRQQARCAIFISFTERRNLRLLYTEDEVPTAGRNIRFVIENDPDNLGRIGTLSSVTDADGVGQVEVRPNRGEIGQFVVKATADNTDLPPKYFDVVVTPKGQVPMTVIGSYSGTRAVGSYGVRLYRQNNGTPDCRNLLDLYENETATQARDGVLMNQSAQFPDFDNLEADGTQKYTVLAIATNQSGAIIAWGCNDADGEVRWGLSTTVQVPLVDRPPLYAGTYEVTTFLNFISAFPEPARGWIEAVLSIFENPIDGIYQLVCVILRDSDNQFCTFRESGIGQAVLDTVNNIILALLPENIRRIFDTGADIGAILQRFEVDETLIIRNEPDEFGVFAPGDISHTWLGTRFRWRLNQDCPPDSTTCGVTQFNLNAIGSEAVVGHASGEVEAMWDLHIDTHSVNLRYGSFLSAMLQQVVFPLITGEPQVTSYRTLLLMLFGGGIECVTDTNRPCCQRFGENVGGSFQGAAEAGCNAVVDLVPNTLQGLFDGLELNSADAFTLATKVGCALEDSNGDMVVDRIGSNNNRCQWDARLRFGQNQTEIEGSFVGRRSQ